MISLALAIRPAAPSIITVLFERHRMLATYGAIMVALAALAMAMQSIDPRVLASGAGIWVKPTKFFFSVGIFALTAAWFFGYVRPERRQSPAMRRTAILLIATGTFELAYICWQAAQGLESHFNVGTPFHILMYALMGAAALLLVGTTLPLAWEIGRRPAAGLPRSFVAAVVIGLLLTFLLGGGFGGYMSSQPGHAVGAEGGNVFLFGWNRLGGDLRIAHFLGIHAEQAIPILAALTAGLAVRGRWLVLIVGSLAYVAITLTVFAQAVAGRALLPV
ncbi:hypothetical protein [Sphingosinicella rhizophila]|uniref:Uncharacterized protein n=1 Tax=Sphingosinicella rhizophila TaxID=3050082 RepID=A0ABU3Q4S1_9SPHN|nr:hypothetical protein [Sphingosinicella sp. GR2756]MDT9597958.1 hypothetical protein [Sphingosinicella sp. GR2756]